MAAEPKTRPTAERVSGFIAKLSDPEKRKSCTAVARMMKDVTGKKAVMWGRGIVGFGSRPIVYASGKSLDWPIAAFAPRKNDVTLYISRLGEYKALLGKLGKYTMGKGCLHIRKLEDVDLAVLKRLLAQSVKDVRPG